MIRNIITKDKYNFLDYYSKQLNVSFKEAEIKFNKILKNSSAKLILVNKDVEGICWTEKDDSKKKHLFLLVNHWKIAESFIQSLRWDLSGEYEINIPKYHFLNRTLNKNGFKFYKVDDKNNYYKYTFIKRILTNAKSESDNDD